ncbi:MAG: hypothetical protein Ct9H300mP12_16260 [Acidimicrobiales bacterium]|nr:MAG: hypothetical protein Ct9H300mP12_16260 [Acidimicrobiales bacterium]
MELPRRLIDLYTYRTIWPLDPFLGSGSTMVAAARAGRRGVGFDLDPEYVTLAKQRRADELRRLDEQPVAAWRRSDLAGTSVSQDGLSVKGSLARLVPTRLWIGPPRPARKWLTSPRRPSSKPVLKL